MTLAAAASSLPMAIGLLVALGCFGSWAALVAGPWGRAAVGTVDGLHDAGPRAEAPAEPVELPAGAISVIVGPRYRIAAPDDEAVAAAMALRVAPPRAHLWLVVDRGTVVPDEVQRSA